MSEIIGLTGAYGGGSFYFPTPPISAHDCINFWTNIRVPDEALGRFSAAISKEHQRKRRVAIDAELSARNTEWLAENPKPKRTKDLDSWKTQHRDEYERIHAEISSWEDSALSLEPPNHFDYQQLARVAQIVTYGPDGQRDKSEFQKLIHRQVELVNGPMTIKEAWQKYELGKVQSSLEFRDSTAEIISALDGVKNAVRKSAESTEQMWRLDNGGYN